MSDQAGETGQPSIDITMSNVDIPRDQLRETLIRAIDAELERQATEELVDVHLKTDNHIKA
jgi:hypothetical protein